MDSLCLAAAQVPQGKLGQLTMDGSGAGGVRLRGPLGSRNFRLLVACNIISVAGSAVSFVAIPFAVLRIGDRQATSDTSRRLS